MQRCTPPALQPLHRRALRARAARHLGSGSPWTARRQRCSLRRRPSPYLVRCGRLMVFPARTQLSGCCEARPPAHQPGRLPREHNHKHHVSAVNPIWSMDCLLSSGAQAHVSDRDVRGMQREQTPMPGLLQQYSQYHHIDSIAYLQLSIDSSRGHKTLSDLYGIRLGSFLYEARVAGGDF
jgi:hypothetical protein